MQSNYQIVHPEYIIMIFQANVTINAHKCCDLYFLS